MRSPRRREHLWDFPCLVHALRGRRSLGGEAQSRHIEPDSLPQGGGAGRRGLLGRDCGLASPWPLVLEAVLLSLPLAGQLTNLRAFARRPRISETSPVLDRAEMEWWNSNASLIERIWGLPDPLCQGARGAYIRDIGRRFHRLLGRPKLRVLEIACGSGWPGRLLSSPNLKVVGIDFSEGQLVMARQKAVAAGLENCEYVQMDINAMNDTFRSGEFDGAFIHCGIHHLASSELEAFAAGLALVPPGFVAIMVEPVYLDQEKFVGRLLDKALRAAYVLLRKFYIGNTREDEVVHAQQQLIDCATQNGWWFSPKEAPFDVPELRRLFGRDFEIREITPVTRFGLEAAQYLATLRNQARAARLGTKLLPLFSRQSPLV